MNKYIRHSECGKQLLIGFGSTKNEPTRKQAASVLKRLGSA